ncbi:MAG: FecCD family ABC transporter permease [Pyramidobacter sp.]|jgi:iron complex transport system permease protein
MSQPSEAAVFEKFRRKRRRFFALLGAALLASLLLTALWRIAQGEWDIPLSLVFQYLSPALPEAERRLPEALVVRSVRLPRLLAALGSGGLLAASGAVLQGLLANPLAEPYTLGIASGAAFGGTLGFFVGRFAVTPLSFAGAMAALCIVSLIARRYGCSGSYLVLAGIITNAVLSAGVTFLKAMADDRLGAIVLWLMGSFSGASPSAALSVWCGAAVVLLPAWFLGRQLDAISLGDGQGELLGINEARIRFLLICLSSVGVALTVSNFGIIGFVGLVAPHMVRQIIGPAHRPLLIFSFLTGGLLLALADGAAQRLGELPVGVLTALLGGPFFCWILVKRR